jgi:hypothetical protein
MGYYLRVLSQRPERMSLADLQSRLKTTAPKATLTVEDGDQSNWTQLLVAVGDRDVCELICDLDEGPDCLLREETSEFVAEIANGRPQSAVRWLGDYLAQVRSIYAIRVLFGDHGGDWETIGAVKDAIHQWSGGIIQADNEGFSNEEGYHILWQFSDSVTGSWHMAVLDTSGTWRRFEMDLGDKGHKDAFWRGEIPQGVAST